MGPGRTPATSCTLSEGRTVAFPSDIPLSAVEGAFDKLRLNGALL